MKPKPTIATPNITQKSCVIECSGWLPGFRVFWLPPQPATASTSSGASKAARVISRGRVTPQTVSNTSPRSGQAVVSISISRPPVGRAGHSPPAARSATSSAASRS